MKIPSKIEKCFIFNLMKLQDYLASSSSRKPATATINQQQNYLDPEIPDNSNHINIDQNPMTDHNKHENLSSTNNNNSVVETVSKQFPEIGTKEQTADRQLEHVDHVSILNRGGVLIDLTVETIDLTKEQSDVLIHCQSMNSAAQTHFSQQQIEGCMKKSFQDECHCKHSSLPIHFHGYKEIDFSNAKEEIKILNEFCDSIQSNHSLSAQIAESSIEKKQSDAAKHFLNEFNKFKCDHCYKMFSTINDIYHHWEQMHQQNRKLFLFVVSCQVICYHCNKAIDIVSIWYHKCQQSQVNAYMIKRPNYLRCGLCDFIGKIKNDIFEHSKKVHTNDLMKIDEHTVFLTDSVLDRLLEIVYSVQHKCSLCDLIWPTRESYEKHHENEHSNTSQVFIRETDVTYHCSEETCKHIDTNALELAKHVWLKYCAHFMCKYCDHIFKLHVMVVEHHRIMHNDENAVYRVVDVQNQFRAKFEQIKLQMANGLVITKKTSSIH